MPLQLANQEIISRIVDKHLELLAHDGLSRIDTGEGDNFDMIRPFRDAVTGEEYSIWVPIPTQITEQEIEALEDIVKCSLPKSYRFFLQYRFFFELYIDELNMYNHTAARWKKEIVDRVLNGYPRKFLMDKGYLPFAGYSDWGNLCFDTNQNRPGNEYPVVLWDHDSPDGVTPISDSFTKMLQQLSDTDDENRQ